VKERKVDTKRLLYYRQPQCTGTFIKLVPYVDYWDEGATNYEEIMVASFNHDHPVPVFKGGNNGGRNERHSYQFDRGSRLDLELEVPEPLDLDDPDLLPLWEFDEMYEWHGDNKDIRDYSSTESGHGWTIEPDYDYIPVLDPYRYPAPEIFYTQKFSYF